MRVALLLLALLPLAFAVYISPLPTANCLKADGGCAFTDPTIWPNNTLPTPQDGVILAANSTAESLLFYTTNATSLFSLTLGFTTFEVRAGHSLSVVTFLIGESSELSAGDGARIDDGGANSTLVLDPSSSITLSANSNFTWGGFATIYGTLTAPLGSAITVTTCIYSPIAATLAIAPIFTTLQVYNNSTVGFPAGVEGALMANPGSAVAVSSLFFGSIIVQEGATVTIANGIAEISSLSGSGTLSIQRAHITILPQGQVNFNGTLNIAGDTTFTAVNTTLSNVVFDSLSNVTVIGDGLVLSGNTSIVGELVARNQGITIDGITVIRGSVTSSSSSITVNAPPNPVFVASDFVADFSSNDGSFTNALIVLPSWNFNINNTKLNLGALLHADITLDPTSVLTVTSSAAQVVGNVINSGKVIIGTDNQLNIYSGNYQQTPAGSISVTLSNEKIPAMFVNGSINLDQGTLMYSIEDKPFLKNAKFLVAESNSTITGTFNGDALNLPSSAVKRSLKITVDTKANQILIQYNFSAKDVPAWQWAIVGVAGALIIVVTIALGMKCRNRQKYESIRH